MGGYRTPPHYMKEALMEPVLHVNQAAFYRLLVGYCFSRVAAR